MQPVFFQKEDGTKEEFAPEKLKRSLMKAGAGDTLADSIVNSIVTDIASHEIVEPTSSDIYKKAFHELSHHASHVAARYSLRRSLMGFGPTGFPFEDYMAELFKAQGFSTLTDQVVFGSCVPHEVDVVVWNKDTLYMAEVKYHNEPVGKTDLKVALYVKARYDDIKENLYGYGKITQKLTQGWLITNTKFTETAIKYGECNNVRMLSWNYPTVGNLHDLIEETKLHPITCLTSLNDTEKRLLLSHKIVLCKTIYSDRKVLKDLDFSDAKIFSIMEEISGILRDDVEVESENVTVPNYTNK